MTTCGYSDKNILFVKFKYSMMRVDYVFLYRKIQCAYVMVNDLIIISIVWDQYINLCLSSKSSISSILHKVEPKISQYLFLFLSYVLPSSTHIFHCFFNCRFCMFLLCSQKQFILFILMGGIEISLCSIAWQNFVLSHIYLKVI